MRPFLLQATVALLSDNDVELLAKDDGVLFYKMFNIKVEYFI
jgi:hypothetical protein